MINFNEQLSQADAQWILEEVVPKATYRIDHKTLVWWADAHNKAFAKNKLVFQVVAVNTKQQ
jgi:hypothetical protein